LTLGPYFAPPVRLLEPEPAEVAAEIEQLASGRLEPPGAVIYSTFAPGREPDVWPPPETPWFGGWRGVALGAVLAVWAAGLIALLKLYCLFPAWGTRVFGGRLQPERRIPMRKLLLATVMSFALASGANAVIVNVGDVGASGTTNLQGFVDINNSAVSIPGLTGTLFLEYDGVSNGGLTWNFDYTVTNTSSGNVTMSSIGSFGLNTTPNVTAALSTGLYDLALLDPQFPNVNGANIIEMCFSAGNNSCNGDGNTLTPGQSASGEFTLTFSSVLASMSLDAAYLRFQAIDAINPSLSGASGVGFNVGNVVINPLAVPGPLVGAGLPGMVAALLTLIGFNRWRRRRHA